MKLKLAVGVTVLMVGGLALAQTAPKSFVGDAAARTWEYGALLQGGNGLTEDRGGFHFLMAGGHLGKVLIPEMGHGRL